MFAAAIIVAASAQTNPPVSLRFTTPAKGPAEVGIRNQSKVALTAYAYTVSFAANGKAGHLDEIQDTAILFSAPPIGPNAEVIRRTGGGSGITNISVQFRAAVFADGTSFGDAATVKEIRQQRRSALKDLDGLATSLKAAREAHTKDAQAKRDALIARLETEQQTKTGAALRSNYGSVLRSLKGASNLDGAIELNLRNLELVRARLSSAEPNLAAN
jgi:hypothetical protein